MSDQLAILAGAALGLSSWIAYRRYSRESKSVTTIVYEAIIPSIDLDDGIGQEVRAAMFWSFPTMLMVPVGTFFYYSLRKDSLLAAGILQSELAQEAQIQQTIGDMFENQP
jgi:hypothetical protein